MSVDLESAPRKPRVTKTEAPELPEKPPGVGDDALLCVVRRKGDGRIFTGVTKMAKSVAESFPTHKTGDKVWLSKEQFDTYEDRGWVDLAE